MATVRVVLKALGYPNVAPNSVLVLQSLQEVGFKIVLKNMTYSDKEAIEDYFLQHNLNVSFEHVKNPDIDILDNKAVIGGNEIKNSSVDKIWEEIDKLCISRQIYERNPIDSYIPSYKPDSYFLVLDYGLPTQLVDSKPVMLKAAHQKGSRIMNARRTINTIDVVDSTTLKIVDHWNKRLKKFEASTEEVFFNVLV